jgi:hypothetical protein
MLGDVANITSINPPDGSAQSSHCSRFYPIARDALLEMHAWGFATRRAKLALLSINPAQDPLDATRGSWKYAYIAPSGATTILSVYDAGAGNDLMVNVPMANTIPNFPNAGLGVPVPQPYIVETNENGDTVIYTDLENASVRYTTIVTDTTKFPSLFVEALSMLLGAHLAGPVLKGAEGRAASTALMNTFFTWWKDKAVTNDSADRKIALNHGPSWMVNR